MLPVTSGETAYQIIPGGSVIPVTGKPSGYVTGVADWPPESLEQAATRAAVIVAKQTRIVLMEEDATAIGRPGKCVPARIARNRWIYWVVFPWRCFRRASSSSFSRSDSALA